MTAQHPDPRVDVPEADRLEQQTPAGAPEPGDRSSDTAAPPTSTDTADVADRLEQLEDVPSEDDEDYPHEV